MSLGSFRLDLLPIREKTRDVGGELFGRSVQGSRANDHAIPVRSHLVDDIAESRAVFVGKTSAYADVVGLGNKNEVAARQRWHTRETCTLGAHRILGDLHQYLITLLENLLDRLLVSTVATAFGSNIRCVENAVLVGSEVEEGSLHSGQDISGDTQVDIAGQGVRVPACHEVLNEDRPFENDDLSLLSADSDQHLLPCRLGRKDDLIVNGATRPRSGGGIAAGGLLAPRGPVPVFLGFLLLLGKRSDTPDFDLSAPYPESLSLLDRLPC